VLRECNWLDSEILGFVVTVCTETAYGSKGLMDVHITRDIYRRHSCFVVSAV
jgi:hypothetical protein